MKYFLNTDACINFLRGENPELRQVLESKAPGDIVIPDIVAAELLTTAWLSAKRAKNRELVKQFLSHFESAPFDKSCTQIYADICARIEKHGATLSPNSLVVAAIVLANNGVLVTSRQKEFAEVRGLSVETWV
jgi:tRNA(fMet)-specific endonuclease VapC